jgi:hypothetical protein
MLCYAMVSAMLCCYCHPRIPTLTALHSPAVLLLPFLSRCLSLSLQARMLLASTSEIYGDPKVGRSPSSSSSLLTLIIRALCFLKPQTYTELQIHWTDISGTLPCTAGHCDGALHCTSCLSYSGHIKSGVT